jgi:very-short-patch-repair endonuclease
MRVFEKLYEIRGQIEREGEKLELVLGDGILGWKQPKGDVFHPVLLQRLQLEFEPKVPEFVVVEAESPVELYSSLFQSIPEVEGKALARVRQELENGKFHPLGKEDTSGLLRSLVAQISSQGHFLANDAPKPLSDFPKIGRCPVLFLRPRNLGFAVALRSLIESLPNVDNIPPSLLRVVGIEDKSPGASDSGATVHSVKDSKLLDVLLSKAANLEQVRIVQRLEVHGSVLVQGPPGTGKTHTIANIIGHLLAQGRSILVTSHASKALRVVREQVVPQLRPLCVSVLDSDIESRKQLESSVDAIVSRLSMEDARQLESEVVALERKRSELLLKRNALDDALLNARSDEYRDLVVSGVSVTPSDAAKWVCARKTICDYIPGPVELGASIPLSATELSELYETNGLVSPEDEAELRGMLPNIRSLPSSSEFEALVGERNELATRDLACRADLWDSQTASDGAVDFDRISQQLASVLEQLRSADRWQLSPMLAGYYGAQHRKSWDGLLNLIEATWYAASDSQDALIRHQPKLPTHVPVEFSSLVVKEIVSHLERGGKLSFLVLLTRPEWRNLIRSSRVAAGQPSLLEHFHALRDLAGLDVLRQQLTSRWNTQLLALGLPAAETFGPSPEAACRQFSGSIKRALDWSFESWMPLKDAFLSIGLRFEQLIDEQPPDIEGGELARLAALLSGTAQNVLATRRNAVRWRSIEEKQAEIIELLSGAGGDEQSTHVVGDLQSAVRAFNPSAYSKAVDRLAELHDRRKHLERRRQLLRLLEPAAPGWATAIKRRTALHDESKLPPNIQDAWLWRQLNDELDRRGRISIRELQAQSAGVSQALQEVTAELIERKAWAAQLRRTERNLSQKQALVGWLDTVKKMGKGTGIRVPRLKAEASRLMTQCRGAVPVWIMPLSRVADSFDPAVTRFDVVIIDEASQSDVMGLLALYLGNKSIVVGDHEQVSPSAVGQDLAVVQHLIDEHLEGVPNNHLYDGQTSIYDLARQSFGGTIRLVEHFRCVPEIIQFSNQLSYEGAIRPLRDNTKVTLKPHVIAHRVNRGLSQNKINEQEAEEVAALVLACCEQPEYANKEFGIVSMVGDDQAYRIDSLLRKYLSEQEFKLKHNILCGNPAHFQGDERDVVFLSVVDTSDGGVLRRREEPMFKQRYNVAASRAKDQMWVVHSLDPRSHLQPGDLRRRLIEYAEDPYRVIRAIDSIEQATESPFEKEVATRLVRAGFRVIPQWRVGHYRIDLVVESAGRRIAVECDGDRFHPIEKLHEDMARQAVLERLGWTFIRLRGSRFYRDPDDTTASLISSLRDAGIEPDGSAPEMDVPCGQGRELVERVLRRADAIKRGWRDGNAISDLTPSADEQSTSAERGAGLEETVAVGSGSPDPSGLSPEAARAKLVALRELRIAKDCSKLKLNVPLLRDQMITLLLHEQPVNETEWSARVPVWMRREAEKWQVQKYLPVIFEIISSIRK